MTSENKKVFKNREEFSKFLNDATDEELLELIEQKYGPDIDIDDPKEQECDFNLDYTKDEEFDEMLEFIKKESAALGIDYPEEKDHKLEELLKILDHHEGDYDIDIDYPNEQRLEEFSEYSDEELIDIIKRKA